MGAGTRARIGIVDDHPTVLLGARGVLAAQPDMAVAAAAGTVQALLRTAPDLDLVLLDLILADDSTPSQNIALLRHLGIPVLAFTSGDRPEMVREAARAGAVGMIRKSEPPQAILDAVRSALGGEPVASADWAAAIDDDTTFVTARLSAREAEVLALYASGETARRVADELCISFDTVQDHVRSIRAKYAAVSRPARSKVELYQRAVEDGLLPSAQGHAVAGQQRR